MLEQGKVAIIGRANGKNFEGNLNLISVLYKLGVRVIQVAYHKQNYFGAGCTESVDKGLSDLGRELVAECNARRILLDVSHCGENTAMEVLKFSKSPIALTHITPAALVEIRRAKSDEVLKAVASKGGVIGQVIWTSFCERRNRMGMYPSLSDYVDIIDYLVNLVGVEHVGLGSDLCPFWQEHYDEFMDAFGDSLLYPHKRQPWERVYVDGFDSIFDTIKITEELLRRGYSDDDTKKILGGNWLRLLKEVWK